MYDYSIGTVGIASIGIQHAQHAQHVNLFEQILTKSNKTGMAL